MTLDFADDLALLSSKKDHLQENTEQLSTYTKQTGLRISLMNTHVISINRPTQARVKLEGEVLQTLETFIYLGSVMSHDRKGHRGQTWQILCSLQQTSIWKSKEIAMRTKVKLYNSDGKSVLLYGWMPQENM